MNSTANSLNPTALPDSAIDLLHGRDLMLAQMIWVRQYTLQLIQSVPDELWYVIPGSAPSHLAWQVGHIAVAQYGLMLFRQRGRAAGDMEIMPGWLRKQFGKGSVPASIDRSVAQPSDLLHLLALIHKQACFEVATLSDKILAEPTEMPFAAYPTKLGALLFCPIHESIHAGQIGVLRRLHGLEPIR